MTRKYIALLIVLLFSLCTYAQLEVKEGSFKEVQGFVNINVDKMYDDNDKPYSVIKVKTESINDKERRDLLFQGDAQTYIECEYKVGEVWLYISYYATYLKISHPDFSSTEFTFPFDMEPKKGYELLLINKSGPTGWASLTIKTKPDNGASVMLNGRDLDEKTPYTNKMIPSGKYDITVSKEKFVTKTETVYINDGDDITVEIEMQYQYGSLSIESEPSGATIFIDGESFGTTPTEINDIIVGTYKLRLEKNGHIPVTKNIVLSENNKLIINDTLYTPKEYGAIYGLFTVSDTTKVLFSQGNLQYKASTNTWRFAENQWDIVGENNKNISESYDGWIDLFGWGTGDAPTCASKYKSEYYKYEKPYFTFIDDTTTVVKVKHYDEYDNFIDWGSNISSSLCNNWRTLSQEEWSYVFDKRVTVSGIRYAKANVNGINGVVLLPDNWTNSVYYLYNTNNDKASFISNNITLSDWQSRLERNGAVFLPIAGNRSGTTVSRISSNGGYWSSSEYTRLSNSAEYLFFDNENLKACNNGYRKIGRSVRLVCDFKY